MTVKLAATFFVLALTIPPVIRAQEAEVIRQQISTQQQQLEKINKEIEVYEKELVQVGAKKQTLQTAVNELDVTLKKTTAQVKATQTKISTTELEIKELDGSISEKEQLIAVDAQALGETLRKLQGLDEASFVEHLLAEDSLSGLWDETASIATLQDAMRDHVKVLQETKEALSQDLAAEEARRKLLAEQHRALAAEERSVAVTKQEQASLLGRTKSQESEYQKLLADKKAAKQQFESALNELESKLQYTLDPDRVPSAGKGVLRWPLDSVHMTQSFGVTADSKRLYVSGSHNGVDFRASVGTPVKAALSGTIQATGNSDAIRGCYSYGKWVLVKHGNGLTTLYAHLSQINASEGEAVGTGGVIGYSGATGYATGPHLHFGVYASDAVQVRQLGTNTPCGKAIIPVSPATGYLNPLDYL